MKPRKVILSELATQRVISRLTGMGLWESVWITIGTVNGEFLNALDTLKIQETIEGYPRCSSRKAQHFGSFFAVTGFESSPPPDNVRI